MSNKKFRGKPAVVFSLLFIFSILFYAFSDACTVYLRNILEFEATKFVIWIFVFLIYLCYYFFSKSKDYNQKPIITGYFSDFFDIIIGGGAIATAIVSSVMLLKGFYIQKVFETPKYYLEFDDIDLWTIFLTMAFLLYFLSMRVAKVIKELFWISKLEEVDAK